MDTDVYLFCPLCNGITPGTGSGDMTDRVWCEKCKTAITAKRVGRLAKHPADESPRPFYMEVENANTYWD
jgi:hypothetical protein